MKKNRQVISQIAIILIFMVGVLTTLYPFYVDALNNVIDQVRVDRYLKESQKEFEAERKRLAEENNKLSDSGLAPGADPFANPNGGTVTAAYYKKHLIGTINLPDLAIELPLFDTTNDDLLEQGATVLDGTSFPVGGASTHAVISAHRGLPERELFTNLPELKNGDIFLLNVLGETLAYEVFDSQVVTPDQTSVLKIEPGQDLVTLMTCTPYMINSHRLLVTGKRVPYTPAAEKKQVKGDRFRKLKQIAILAGTALLILAAIYQLYHVIARYRLRKVRFDFTVCLEGVAEHTPIALYDKKGKKALRRNGKAYQELTDQTGQVTFTDLPGDCYRLKLGKSWLVQFGLKKKKRPSKIWKINKKKVMLKEERMLEVK